MISKIMCDSNTPRLSPPNLYFHGQPSTKYSFWTAWQQRQRLLFRLKTQLCIWKARLPSLLPCHFPWQNFCYMFCCQSESSRICLLGKYLLSVGYVQSPMFNHMTMGKNNNRQGRVLTTKTFTLIHCFFLSASIATWFQPMSTKMKFLILKFLLFQWIISNFLVSHFLMNKAQQSQRMLKDIYIYIVFETGTWTKRGRETNGQNHCSRWRERYREPVQLRGCSRHSAGHKETNDPD